MTMRDTEMYWLNIDRPTKRSVLHTGGCRHAQAKHETLHKGVGQLKRDGGWLSFTTQDEAQDVVRRDLQPDGFMSLIRCADCLG